VYLLSSGSGGAVLDGFAPGCPPPDHHAMFSSVDGTTLSSEALTIASVYEYTGALKTEASEMDREAGVDESPPTTLGFAVITGVGVDVGVGLGDDRGATECCTSVVLCSTDFGAEGERELTPTPTAATASITPIAIHTPDLGACIVVRGV